MEISKSESYAKAGVDVTAGYKSVELIKDCVTKTNIPGVLGGIGDFGGMFQIDTSKYIDPVLVSGTDGVGTKLKLAFLADKHDTIGIDCVAMCVNDIICGGAKPLFFLDYIACGKNIPEKIAEIVKGVADGCIKAGCALVGGETAEHPGLMSDKEYDLAGFSVGIVEKEKIIKKESVCPGDILLGIKSSGLHSNGFSLIRKIFKIDDAFKDYYVDDFSCTLLEELLTPTKIYVKPILKLIDTLPIHGIAHITGGGFYENIPRMLPQNTIAFIEKDKCFHLPVFDLVSKVGDINEKDMYNTFNMGTGMVLAIPNEYVDEALEIIKSFGEDAAVIGEVRDGERGVILV